jgi:hypothetical protein
MDQEREFERLPAGYHAEVRRLDTGAIVGHLADISLGGAMLIAEAPLTVGATLALSVELPRSARIGENLAVDAVVRWCEPDLTPGLYSVGLAFRGKGPAAAEAHHTLQRMLGDRR